LGQLLQDFLVKQRQVQLLPEHLEPLLLEIPGWLLRENPV